MNPTDYLKQKGFSENGEVKMSFQDLDKLLLDYHRFLIDNIGAFNIELREFPDKCQDLKQIRKS